MLELHRHPESIKQVRGRVNSNISAIPLGSLYENSTHGIVFQYPYIWNKVETLAGRTTLIEFTYPSRNVTEGTDLPTQLAISIEKGLGNVTFDDYTKSSDPIRSNMMH